MQNHIRTALLHARQVRAYKSLPGGFPAHRTFRIPGTTGKDGDLIGDHESGIKAHAKLADQFRRQALLVFLQLFEKTFRAGIGNRTDIVLDFLGGHADAIVGNCQQPGLCIYRNFDLPLRIILEDALVFQRFKTRPVNRIRGIRQQFPQKNLLVRIQRMNYQFQ